MSQGINFFSIRTEEPDYPADWTRKDTGGRVGRWLRPSDYDRLIRRERMQYRALTLGVLTGAVLAVALLYAMR